MFQKGEPSATAAKIAVLGGKARAVALTPKRRKRIARLAAKKKWAKFYAERRAGLAARVR